MACCVLFVLVFLCFCSLLFFVFVIRCSLCVACCLLFGEVVCCRLRVVRGVLLLLLGLSVTR